MSRQQKREQRESEIIQGTLQLLQDKSFLDLKMSEVAQVAGCSMGAIYSHFSSKEDLLLGCALDIMNNQAVVLHKALELIVNPLDQLLLVTFCCINWDEQQPANYALSQLALNPCVWQRASSHRNNAMNQEVEKIDLLIQDIATRALQYLRQTDVSRDDAKALYMGLISISHGLFMLGSSGYGEYLSSRSESDGDDGMSLYLTSIQRYLAGWELAKQYTEDDLRPLYQQAENMVLDHIRLLEQPDSSC